MAADDRVLSTVVQTFRKLAVDDARVWPLIALSAIGIYVVAGFFMSILRIIFSLLLPGKSLRSFGAGKGAWAVVTGSTAGIGAEFARQLAQAGFNIIVVSRDQAKLQAQARDLVAATGVKVMAFAIDFVDATFEEYAELAKLLLPLDIGVLINNVGLSHAYPEYFVDSPAAENEAIIAINVGALVRMTRMVAPAMAARKRGFILNFSSMSSYVHSPMLPTYAGTKAFVSSFSQVLGHELRQHNVTVRCLNTYFVATGMSKIRRASFFVPTPKAYVRSVLGHIGNAGGAVGGLPYLANPYPSHALLQFAVDRFVPWSLLQWFVERDHIRIRRRALAKRARDQKKA